MMKPDVAAVLADHADRLATRIVPQLSGFDANGTAMIARMLAMVAEHWDGAAAGLVAENRALRALFRRAAATVEAPLAARLAALADTDDDDLRLSALDAANAALRGALVELHAEVERLGDRALDDAIWAELVASTERRRIASANF